MKDLDMFNIANFSKYKEKRITNLLELDELCEHCRLNRSCDCEYCDEAYSTFLTKNHKSEEEDLKAFAVRLVSEYLKQLIKLGKEHSEIDIEILGEIHVETDSTFTVEVKSDQKMFDIEFNNLLNELPIDKVNIYLEDVDGGTEFNDKYEEGFKHTGEYKLTLKIWRLES